MGSSYLNPEEQLRQKLVKVLINTLHFPKSLISLEISLADAAIEKKNEALPDRFIDILCYRKEDHGSLSPLLIVECKAKSLNRKAVEQLLGYNHYIKAPFVALAAPEKIITGWVDRKSGEYQFVQGLFKYEALIEACRSNIS